ncbi:MAG: hypothetical protein FI734_00565 [SAR202 cluster bacterium]|nr:hypothetical protein [SAR202 cluster bacterium]|tara:strand:- start:36185 stop:36787 length:603 start_codon:yes stop_codon:yes gene_type:complete
MESIQDSVRFGEVIESSIEHLTGQCHSLYDSPALGSLVKIGDSIFGIIDGIYTGAIDPSRGVIARGHNVSNEEEIYQDHPQLDQLMRTTISVIIIGFEENAKINQYLPPLPPRIHSFIYRCTPDEIRKFIEHIDFLALLLRKNIPTIDDVVAATIKHALQVSEDPSSFLLKATQSIACQLPSDLSRVGSIIKRLPMDDLL